MRMPAVVLVEVLGVRAVVDAMMGRRVEHRLEPPWQPVDELGVDPVLVDEVEAARDHHHPRRHAEQRERRVEEERSERRPRLAQRRREVVVPARVMVHVARPEEPVLVLHAVVPVVGEVPADHRDRPAERAAPEVEDAMRPQPRRESEDARVDRRHRRRASRCPSRGSPTCPSSRTRRRRGLAVATSAATTASSTTVTTKNGAA